MLFPTKSCCRTWHLLPRILWWNVPVQHNVWNNLMLFLKSPSSSDCRCEIDYYMSAFVWLPVWAAGKWQQYVCWVVSWMGGIERCVGGYVCVFVCVCISWVLLSVSVVGCINACRGQLCFSVYHCVLFLCSVQVMSGILFLFPTNGILSRAVAMVTTLPRKHSLSLWIRSISLLLLASLNTFCPLSLSSVLSIVLSLHPSSSSSPDSP